MTQPMNHLTSLTFMTALVELLSVGNALLVYVMLCIRSQSRVLSPEEVRRAERAARERKQ